MQLALFWESPPIVLYYYRNNNDQLIHTMFFTGKIRDLTALHRYFYITMSMENDRSLVITVVCHKKTFSR